jgi:carboxypeptidase Taq
MASLLSPSETAGLSGAALDSRIRRAAGHVSDLTFSRISRRLRDDALANELTYERDGKMEPIPVMLRPLLAMNEQLGYVQYVCQRITEALKRLPSLYLNVEKIRKIIAVTPTEEAWLKELWTPAHDRNNTVYGRLDAVCDFTASGWQNTLHFMEANLSGVGGISYSPLAENLVMRDIVPTLLAHDPTLRIELPRDQRDLFIQVLIDHARNIGRSECRLCLVEPKYAEDGINEQAVLAQHFAKQLGITIMHADPSELRVKDGEVWYGDTIVDVAYRDYETRDLIAAEEELGKPLEGMRALFKGNRIISSMVGDFDHKSCWEILTDPAIAEKYFSAEECKVFRKHILWTRVISDRKTSLPHNADGDLLEFARTHREELIIKPNRSYGGDGVTIGPSTSQADWDKLIDEALANASDPDMNWVVQAITRLPVSEFPIVGKDGRIFNEPFYSVMGFAPTDSGLGIMCRVSQKQVVNVAQHGGMAAVLIGHAPHELKMPKRSQERANGSEQDLRNRIADILHFDNAIAVLEWDEETALPLGSREERGEQLAALESARHTILTADSLGDLIEEVALEKSDDLRWKRELELLREMRESEIALPADLIRAYTHARAMSSAAWEEARETGDFAILQDALAETVKLSRETAQALDGNLDPYDVLLDEYEPGMTRARLEPVLADLKARLVPLFESAKASTANWPGADVASRRAADDAMWQLCKDLLKKMGFSFDRGHLDRATHPGTTALGFDDVRLALRTNGDGFIPTLLTTLHEGGHGLYDQGLARADQNTLLARAPSMGLHEAQARFWENHIGRSKSFWTHILPDLQARLGQTMSGLDATRLYQSANRVSPTHIRASADEMSYHLHILLRYELEAAMISGDLKVSDLKAAWNERSLSLLGIVPENDNEGILQDGHWPAGMFGYFPTYTVGSLYAAQLAETYAKHQPLEKEITTGNFTPVLGWLRKSIHEYGDRHTADELMEKATGKRLDSEAYFRHLTAKFA